MSIASQTESAGSSFTEHGTRSRSLDRKLRVHVANFAEDLGSEDLSRLCFVHDVPRGVRESRCNSGIDVIRYLEQKGTLHSEEEIVRMMRDLNKEEWARRTEHMIEEHIQSKQSSASSSTPVQESVVAADESTHHPAIPEAVTVRHSQCSHEERKANSLKRQGLYLSQLVDSVEETGDVQGDACQEEEVEKDRARCDSTREDTCRSNSSSEQLQLLHILDDLLKSPEVSIKFGAVLQEEVKRRLSSVSTLSQRSSGYGSMCLEMATNSLLISAYEMEESEQTTCLISQSDTTSDSLSDQILYLSPPRTTSCSSFKSQSLSPTRSGCSRQSSCEDYFTADEEEPTWPYKCGKLSSWHSQVGNSVVGSEERVPSGAVCSSKQKPENALKQRTTLCSVEDSERERMIPILRPQPGRRAKRAHPVAMITSIQSPPPRGHETLVGSMEVKRADLLKALQRQNKKQRYTSYPFPFHSHDYQYQLLLYPSTLHSSAHCTLYLVMLKHENSMIPQLRGKVSVYEGEAEDESETKQHSSPLIEESYCIDPKRLPATPPEAGFVTLVIFPKLIPRTLLEKAHGTSIVVKAVIEQPVHYCPQCNPHTSTTV